MTQLVLECKHYLQPSTSNFTEAAQDYARSCPSSEVVIVNHGGADPLRLIGASDPIVAGRLQFVGNATAETEHHTGTLGRIVASALFPPRANDIAPVSPSAQPDAIVRSSTPVATIALQWDGTLADLDLAVHLFDEHGVPAGSVHFGSKGSLSEIPYALLDQDCRQGPGKETISISHWHAHRYEIVATNYSKQGAISARNVRCGISLGNAAISYWVPASPEREQWVVGQIIVENGNARLVAATGSKVELRMPPALQPLA